ncbi:hypothetical protein ACFRAR_14560 [Kitasatospora sp. NPDC056651]|uniref:hypothetical protein n=1 Tax=Kitasatospora sp. NPDC056651 TaxID=3345892 RepID=UPI00368F9596
MGFVDEGTDPRARTWAPAGQAVALLPGPYAEVVPHGPGTDRISAIRSPMTSRGPGDQSFPGEPDELDRPAQDLFGPHEKLLAAGRRLSPVNAVFRGPAGALSAVAPWQREGR